MREGGGEGGENGGQSSMGGQGLGDKIPNKEKINTLK